MLKIPKLNEKRQRKPMKQRPKRKPRRRQITKPPLKEERNTLRDEK
jgi:hypothetical protein